MAEAIACYLHYFYWRFSEYKLLHWSGIVCCFKTPSATHKIVFLCTCTYSPQTKQPIVKLKQICYQLQAITNSSAFMVRPRGAAAQQAKSLFILTVMLAQTSQLWHWRPVAFMGAGIVCPFSSWVQIALFKWKSKLFKPCPCPFLGHELLRLSWVRVRAFIYFAPKTACAEHCWQHVIKSEITHRVIYVPIVRSHFGCLKCWWQLECPKFLRVGGKETNVIS